MSSVAKQLSFLNKISYTTKKAQVFIKNEKIAGLKLIFQLHNHNGHMGARKFWHTYLPTIQFYNPHLKIDLIRIKNEQKGVEVPCKIEILNKESSVLETINMQHKNDTEIMDELLTKLDHETIPETELVKV